MALGILLAAATAALILWLRQPDETHPPTAARTISPVTPTTPDFQKLKGQWLRPDGGYIIDVTNVEADGKMKVGYYNPNPIRISRAEARHEGATTIVFIELNDAGYPGSTYTLHYDPANDQLQGVYYQAAMQQSFEVVFVRME